MKSPYYEVNTERVLVRKSQMDGERVPVYIPVERVLDREPIERAKAPTSAFARNVVAVSMVATLLVSSVGVTYGRLPGTGSFFADTETSTLNQFFANFLDFAATLTGENTVEVLPDNSASEVPVTVTPVLGSVDTNYRVTASTTAGNVILCNALQAGAPAFSPPYLGSLLALNNTLESNASLTLFLSIPAPIPDLPTGTQCTFDIVFRGWNNAVSENTGYTDEERVSVTVSYVAPVENIESFELVLGASLLKEEEPEFFEEKPLPDEPPTDEPPIDESVIEDLPPVEPPPEELAPEVEPEPVPPPKEDPETQTVPEESPGE